jgi:hypothetical protein
MPRCAIAILSTLLAQPCYADTFCKTIIKVVDDAPSGFIHIRGANLELQLQRYSNVLSPPGTLMNGKITSSRDNCSVELMPTGTRWRYSCEFPTPQSHKGAPNANALSAHLTSCLDSAGKRATVSRSDIVFLYKAVMKDANIEILPGIVEDGYGLRYFMFIDQKAN